MLRFVRKGPFYHARTHIVPPSSKQPIKEPTWIRAHLGCADAAPDVAGYPSKRLHAEAGGAASIAPVGDETVDPAATDRVVVVGGHDW